MIHFRKGSETDIDLYFEWVNDEKVRENSYDNSLITFEEHQNWFFSKLKNPNCFFYLFFDETDTPVGQIRIETINEAEDSFFNIGISIDKKYRGKSLGTPMIEMATDDFLLQHKKACLVAYIKIENEISHKIFKKAGFKREEIVLFKNHQSFKLYKSATSISKKIAIMQPTYLPWLGYFDLIRSVDTFVIYDHVQFEKQSWQQRNRIRNKEGEIMLSIQLNQSSSSSKVISEIMLHQPSIFLKKHLKSIELSYSRAPYFAKIFPEIKSLYENPFNSLCELNMTFILYGMKKLNIQTELLYSSNLNICGSKVDALIDVCKKCDANQYLSPVGSKNYIEENNIFAENGIDLMYQKYTHPTYQQINYKNFISHLSFIDFLMNCSIKEF